MKYSVYLPLLLAWLLGENVADGALPGAVVAWGSDPYGFAAVPILAQSDVVAMAVGDTACIALRTDGRVVVWGSDWYGQTNVPVSAQSGVQAIAAGSYHIVALNTDGRVLAWGYNAGGQTTVPVAAQSGVVAIAAGGYHTLALKDGSVLAWGDNSYGQTSVPAVAQSGVRAITAGNRTSAALKNDGSVVVWGWGVFNLTNVPAAALSGVIAIDGGYSHMAALKNDGSVVVWGGQTSVPVEAQSGVVAISAGYDHTAALKSDGRVVAWGGNCCGQTSVPAFAQSGVKAVAAGLGNNLVLITLVPPVITVQPQDQSVKEWQTANFNVAATGFYPRYQWRKDGSNIDGATEATYSPPYIRPAHAGSYSVVVSNPAGSVTSAPALLSVKVPASGKVVTWGLTDPTEVPAEALSDVTAIAAGAFFTLALKNGRVLAWGNNDYGQTNVPAAAQTGVIAIAAGSGGHVAALRSDGSVVAWGENDFGQTDVPEIALSGVMGIAVGDYYTAVLKTNGSVAAWGMFDDEQGAFVPGGFDRVQAMAGAANGILGLNTDGRAIVCGSLVGVPAVAQSNVTAISTLYTHFLALKNDGSMVAWGFDQDGQATVPVAAQSDVVGIAAGGYHSMALKSDGSAVAWGDNRFGQCDVPPSIQGQILTMTGGRFHSVAIVQVPVFLGVARIGADIILAWPTNAAGYTLQSTLDLATTASWTDVTNAPALEDAQWTVTNSLSGSAQFYRLQKR